MTATPQPAKTPDLGSLLRKPPTRQVPAPPDADKTPAPPPVPQDAPSREHAPSSGQTAKPTRAERTKRTSVAGESQARRGYLRSIQVQLPRTVHARLANAAREQGTTATALMLEAVNATHAQLADALAEMSKTDTGVDDRTLFAVPQARAKAEPAVATTIRITDAQHEAFERLTHQLQTNRSAIIAAAVRAYL